MVHIKLAKRQSEKMDVLQSKSPAPEIRSCLTCALWGFFPFAVTFFWYKYVEVLSKLEQYKRENLNVKRAADELS